MRHDAAVYGRDRRRLAPLGLALALFGFVISPLVHAIVVHGDVELGRHDAWMEDEDSLGLPSHGEHIRHDQSAGPGESAHQESAADKESTPNDEINAHDEMP